MQWEMQKAIVSKQQLAEHSVLWWRSLSGRRSGVLLAPLWVQQLVLLSVRLKAWRKVNRMAAQWAWRLAPRRVIWLVLSWVQG